LFKQKNKNTFSMVVVKNTTGGTQVLLLKLTPPNPQYLIIISKTPWLVPTGLRWLWNFKQIFEKLFGNKRALKNVYRTDNRYARLMCFRNEVEDLPFSSAEQNVWRARRASASLTQKKPNDWTLPQTFSIVQTHFLRPFNPIGEFVVFFPRV
jgi:hypothetical protein